MVLGVVEAPVLPPVAPFADPPFAAQLQPRQIRALFDKGLVVLREHRAIVGAVAGFSALALIGALVASHRPPPEPAAPTVAPARAPPPPPRPEPEPPPPASQPPAAPAPTGRFSSAAARRALDATSRDVARCKRGKTWGTAFATVSFGNGGAVADLVVGSPFRGTPTGECVAETLSSAQVAPFGGQPSVIVYRFFVAPK
jgi:hypothetical protein